MTQRCFTVFLSLGFGTGSQGLPWICALRPSMLGNTNHNTFLSLLELVNPRLLIKELPGALKMREL